ncbi:MAG: dihydrolipoamide acetyltransferase family protein [Peptococcales bacterium]
MARELIMPKLGLTMTEGTIVRWLKKEGEEVEAGEPIAEILSDKSSFDLEAPITGVLLKVLYQDGAVVPVVQPIAYIGQPGERIEVAKDASVPTQEEETQIIEVPTPNFTETDQVISDTRVKISPRAKKLAQEHGVDYSEIVPTGPEGRIIESDVKKYIQNQGKVKATPVARKVAEEMGVALDQVVGSGVSGRVYKEDVLNFVKEDSGKQESVLKEIPYTGIRKLVGDRLSASKFTFPHVYFSVDVDMTEIIKAREKLKDLGVKTSLNDFIVLASARALAKYRNFNASLLEDKIVYHKQINIGIAVATEYGLIVPVVKDVQTKSLSQIATESKDLIERARTNNLQVEEYKNGTFTISNLGMAGIDRFTAIINPPEAAILAVGRVQKKPIFDEASEQFVAKPMMTITLSTDHRINDGWDAALFVTTIQKYLEEPLSLL